MGKINSTHIRIYPTEKEKIKMICKEVSLIEKKDVYPPELLRRALNIPNIKEVLKRDAEIKRRLSR